MSGEEVAAPAVAETPAPSGEGMDLMIALKMVLKKSRAHGDLSRGLREGTKIIEKHAAQLVLLAEDCDQTDYVKLVKALCAEHKVTLFTIPSSKTLGEWGGLGRAGKPVGCSLLVVKDFGKDSEGLRFLRKYLESQWSSTPMN